MPWHDFVFSEEKKFKVIRHLAFWSSWWLYFISCYIIFQLPLADKKISPFYLTPGEHLALKTFLLVLLYALSCYPLIYYILPKIMKGKWFHAAATFFVVCSCVYFVSYYLYWEIFPSIDSISHLTKPHVSMAQSWPALNLGLMNFAKVAAAACIIKYIKYWWLKQKEKQRLEKEKINTELQLLKAQVHPDFLFKTLNNIYTHAIATSPRTSGMLLKLSDLLSYMLYECDKPQVPLEKEIAMMKEYMQLEKLSRNDEPEMQLNLKGDPNGQMIAPFLLLPFIENSLKYCGEMTEQFWINMDLKIDGNNFSMKLTNGVAENPAPFSVNTNGLANVQKRLTLLYPGNHELKMAIEQEMCITVLKIRLSDSPHTAEEKDIDSMTFGDIKNLDSLLKYASQ